MIHIVTTGLTVDYNFGSPCILLGFYELMKGLFGKDFIITNIQDTKLKTCYVDDIPFQTATVKQLSEKQVIQEVRRFRKTGMLSKTEAGKLVGLLIGADVVVDLYGIYFCDNLVMNKNADVISAVRRCMRMLSPIFAAKKIGNIRTVKNTASYGPIDGRTNRIAAGLAGNYLFDTMIAREEESKKSLLQNGVKREILVSPDVANLMPFQLIKKEKAQIGLSVSHQIKKQWKSNEPYITCIVNLCKHIHESIDADLVLIPNECKPNSNSNDIPVAEEIAELLVKEGIGAKVLDVNSMRASEIKNEIASCEMMIASRYHSCVASLSSGVPTLVIGWHYKYQELLEQYHQKKWMISQAECTSQKLLMLFDELWSNRVEEQAVIQAAAQNVKQRVLSVGESAFHPEIEKNKQKCQKKPSVAEIAERGLCSACGACTTVCKRSAIQIQRCGNGFLKAEVASDLCVDCGLCRKVCPADTENGIAGELEDAFIGQYQSAFVGRASDDSIYQNGQSGGVVTALLAYLLDNGLIDSAVVTDFSEEEQRPAAKVVRTKSEILHASGSYYAQTSVLDTIRKNNDELGNYAAVTLGCQSEGLRLLQKKESHFRQPQYNLGLCCAGQQSDLMLKALIQKSGMEGRVTGFRYRNKLFGGWPGNTVVYSGAEKAALDSSVRGKMKKAYGAYRCLFCFDQMNVYSDIVFGDPWGIAEYEKPEGYTVFLVRTDRGKLLIEAAIKAGYIQANEIEPQRFLTGQTIETIAKKRFAGIHALARYKGLPTPDYRIRGYLEGISNEKPGSILEWHQKLECSRKISQLSTENETIKEAEQTLKKIQNAKKWKMLRKRIFRR